MSQRHRQPTERQLAVALRYQQDRDATPRVIAKGQGSVAERILNLARDQNIPVREDSELAQSLAQLDLGALIPSELYPAVAEILAFLYKENQRKGGRR